MSEDRRLIRKATILSELAIDQGTLWRMIKSGKFPQPLVLNAGQSREIVAWRLSDYEAWRQGLPQRMAHSARKSPYERGVSTQQKKPPVTRPIITRPK
jgi:predicted DNA-binding transcriptional regulator AlpA